ncbi:ABC transporter ATP-binding protein [Natronospora cellulosivora (SeqCode)]
MDFLSIKNINKSFKQEDGQKLQVLDNINLDIKKKEFITFIGPSGCGKSTLLNLIAGLEEANSGQILLKEKKINSAANDRVMVFQEAALFPWLSVIDNVMFGLKAKKIDKKIAYESALKQLKAVQLAKFKDSYPHQLSGGMKQKVAIARSLVMNPEILLMDEPFGALDEQTRNILHKELLELWTNTKKTIIFVTHNIREAIKLSDKILVFGTNPGRILETFTLNHPRPGRREDQSLIKLENDILKLLNQENEKKGDLENEALSA